MTTGRGKVVDPAVVARAERALAAMAESYRESALGDVAALRSAVDAARANPDAPDALLPARDVAHNIRGQGSSFGYPLVTRIGSSLYRLLQHRLNLPSPDYATLDAHVAALQATLAARVTGDGDAATQQQAAALEAMTQRLMAQPN